jgi:hypothetical protein
LSDRTNDPTLCDTLAIKQSSVGADAHDCLAHGSVAELTIELATFRYAPDRAKADRPDRGSL